MINIVNKSQAEVEKLFSDENYKQEISIQLAQFLDCIEDEHYELLQNITKESMDKTELLMLEIIALIGNENNGNRMSDSVKGVREFDVNQLVLGIGHQLHTEVPKCYTTAMDIVAEFDTIFWDLTQQNVLSEEGHWYTRTTAVVSLTIGAGASKLQEFSRFRLPLIEKPIDWVEGELQGGYHLDTKKCTLNKGEAKQPQQCLDILNKLQSQQFTIRQYDLMEQYTFTLEQIQSKNWKASESEHIESARIKLQTAQETYETMEGEEFYLANKYDFRGRTYTVGYDINIQGDKYQKALIKPVFIKGVHYDTRRT